MKVLGEHLAQLWYENDKGDRFVPDMQSDEPLKGLPEGFVFQNTLFVGHVSEQVTEMITDASVAACDHPPGYVIPDLGIIDSHDGEICRKCGGTRLREKGLSWEPWHGGRSREIATMNGSWSENLVLAMTRPTTEERERQRERFSSDHQVPQLDPERPLTAPPLFGLEEAIIIAGCSCERCMNALIWAYGVTYPNGDQGYPEMSDEWKRAGTICKFCRHMGFERSRNAECVENDSPF